jgi:hypothetical protein
MKLGNVVWNWAVPSFGFRKVTHCSQECDFLSWTESPAVEIEIVEERPCFLLFHACGGCGYWSRPSDVIVCACVPGLKLLPVGVGTGPSTVVSYPELSIPDTGGQQSTIQGPHQNDSDDSCVCFFSLSPTLSLFGNWVTEDKCFQYEYRSVLSPAGSGSWDAPWLARTKASGLGGGGAVAAFQHPSDPL